MTDRLVRQMEENDRQIEHNTTDTDNIDYQKLALRAQLIAGQKPLLIVLDGANQLSDRNHRTKLLNWLPDFPDNVKIIFSTIEEDKTMQVFKKRKYPVITVYPLLLDQRKELIVVEEGVKAVTTGDGNPGKFMELWKNAGAVQSGGYGYARKPEL